VPRAYALSPDFPLGDALEVFMRRQDAERFVEESTRALPRLFLRLGRGRFAREPWTRPEKGISP